MKNYVSTKEAMAILKCCRSTIYVLVSAGKLTPYRIGKRLVRYDLDELMAVYEPKAI